jgi:putative ABC transport system ATP-binding protein
LSVTPLIQLENISKRYRMGDQDVHALRGVSLSVGTGELVAITGPSGSGKSTLMNLLGCLDRPQEGRYWLDGADVSRLGDDAMADVRNRKLGFVFQQFNLLARANARENVELPLVYAGVRPKERRRRADEALHRVGLSDRRHHRPNQLSGGQQQRVAIARAIVGRPALLLADEPTGNLDSKASYEILTLLKELGQEGMTVVLVTHEPDIAASTHRIIAIRDGVVESDQRTRPVGIAEPPGPLVEEGVP